MKYSYVTTYDNVNLECLKIKSNYSKSAYNEEYRRWKTKRVPRYLQERNKGQKLKTIARFRLGNDWKAVRYWMEEEKKPCRLCKTERETGIHVTKECNYSGTDERIEDLMSEKGQGIEWMKRLKEKRKGKE